MQTETISHDAMRAMSISDAGPSHFPPSPSPSRSHKTRLDDKQPSPSKQSPPRTPLSPSNGQTNGRSTYFDGPSEEGQSSFNPFGLQRTESVYSLSRVSLGSQISQLTALQLPNAATISSNIASIPSAAAAAKVLGGSADQIRRWIKKAAGLLRSMDAEDDIDWAAAGGREGLADIDGALGRFEGLIGVYVTAIEQLQNRADIKSVSGNELEALVAQMETTLAEWGHLRHQLKTVKEQVELAMEWEELWNNVLGDIGQEVDELNRLVFEMEEKRHRALVSDDKSSNGNGEAGVDLGELETIVEDAPLAGPKSHAANRLSLPAFPLASPANSPGPPVAKDDSSLLALFARMQPLRASLDFLPMRLASFNARAESMFPTACEELDSRRKALEHDFKVLQADAEALRSELGEDRWVIVFKNAGRQAQKMCESVKRSIVKLQEAIDLGAQHSNPPSLARKVESFEAKKTHYGPAIQRVLAIIEKGLGDRLTVHGEVLRLRSEMETQWRTLEAEMKQMEAALEDLSSKDNQQLRDSISSSISMDHSASGSGFDNTPGSSPASSVIMTGHEPATPPGNGNWRGGSSARDSSLPRSSGGGRRGFSMPPSTSSPRNFTPGSGGSGSGSHPRKTPVSRFSGSSSRNSSPSDRTPTPSSDQKPRWNIATNTRDSGIGHHFAPFLASQHDTRKSPPTQQQRSASRLSRPSFQLPSPLGREERSVSPGLSSPTLSAPGNIPYRRPASSMALAGGARVRRSMIPERVQPSPSPAKPTTATRESSVDRYNYTSTSTPTAHPRPSRPSSAMSRPAPHVAQTRTSAMRTSGRDSAAGMYQDQTPITSRFGGPGASTPQVAQTRTSAMRTSGRESAAGMYQHQTPTTSRFGGPGASTPQVAQTRTSAMRTSGRDSAAGIYQNQTPTTSRFGGPGSSTPHVAQTRTSAMRTSGRDSAAAMSTPHAHVAQTRASTMRTSGRDSVAGRSVSRLGVSGSGRESAAGMRMSTSRLSFSGGGGVGGYGDEDGERPRWK